MGVNDKLLTVIDKLEANTVNMVGLLENMISLIAQTNSNTSNIYDKLEEIRVIAETTDGRTSAIFELVNSILFHTEAIHGWGLDNAIETLKSEILPPLLSIDTNVGAMRNLTDNFLAPIAENTFHAVLDLQTATLALACLCDLELNPFGPGLNTTPPTDEGVHCQRIQYMLDYFVLYINQVNSRLESGTNITSGVIAALLGIGVIPGITEENIPNDIRAGLTEALSGHAFEQLTNMTTILDQYSSLTTLFWEAESAAEAKQLIDAYFNSHNPGPPAGDKAIKALKCIFNATVLNVLFDQSEEWDLTGFSDDVCGYPDSGEYNTMGSVLCTLAHHSGDFVYNGVEEPFWYAYIHNQPGNEWEWNGYLICDTSIFVEGTGYNESGHLAHYAINSATWHNYRMKIVETDIQVEVRLNNNHYYYLNSDNYTRFPVLPASSAWSICGTGGGEFHIRYQRLVAGVWTDS